MNYYRVFMGVAVLLCSALFCGAAEALSPAVREAIAELSSDQFKVRQAAVEKLQMAMGRQMRAMVASDDPETKARLTSLLQFHEGLTRWMLDVMKLPPERQKEQFDFGLREDVLPLIAGVFSSDVDKRVQGVKVLGKFAGPEATARPAANAATRGEQGGRARRGRRLPGAS